MDEHDLVGLAAAHGTPLHVASARRLRQRVGEFVGAFGTYPAPVRLHFSYKTNPVAGVLRTLHDLGVGAEVSSGHELWLARRLGVHPDGVVFGGANRTEEELRTAVEAGVGLVVSDSLPEIDRLSALTARAARRLSIALRICPEIAPRGMNASSRSGTRQSQFGLDLRSGEVAEAIRRVVASPHLRLRGAMAHIGSGIHHLASFRRAVDRLLRVQLQMARCGAEPDLLDLGGGLGTRFSREFTAWEMLLYLAAGRLPAPPRPAPSDLLARYGAILSEALQRGCRSLGLPLPTLVLEPGRAIVSDCQALLLRVGEVRERPGVGRFAITDGGALSVSLVFLTEHHALLLANREAPVDPVRVHVFGRLPSSLDVVYRNLRLPKLEPGDLLAVMDAGAYFTSTSTNFAGPRPAVVLLDAGEARLVRRRETSQDLAAVELALNGREEAGP